MLGFILVFTTNCVNILSYSLFLKKVGPEYLPYFFMLLNVCSLAVGSLLIIRNFSGLKNLLIATVIMVLLFMGTPWFLSFENGGVLFTIYTAAALFYIYSLMFYWNFVNHVLSIREIKQYSGIIAGMNYAGSLPSGLLIAKFVEQFTVAQCYRYAGLIYLVMAIALVITIRFLPERHDKERQLPDLKLFSLFDMRFVQLLAYLMLAFSFLKYVIEYRTGVVIEAHFSNPQEIAAFSGYYSVVSNSLVLLFQLLILDKVLKQVSMTIIFRTVGIIVAGLSLLVIVYPAFAPVILLQFSVFFLPKVIIYPVMNVLLKAIHAERRSLARFLVTGIVYSTGVIVSSIFVLLLNRVHPPPYLFSLAAGLGGIYIITLAKKIKVSYLKTLLEALRTSGIPQDVAEKPVGEDVIEKLTGRSPLSENPVIDFFRTNFTRIRDHFRQDSLKTGTEPAAMLLDPGRDRESLLRFLGELKGIECSGALPGALHTLLVRSADIPVTSAVLEVLGTWGREESREFILPLIKSQELTIREKALLTVIRIDLFKSPRDTGDLESIRKDMLDAILHKMKDWKGENRDFPEKYLREETDAVSCAVILLCSCYLSPPAWFRVVEIFSGETPDNASILSLADCFQRGVYTPAPLIRAALASGDPPGFPWKIVEALVESGEKETITKDLAGIIRNTPLETLTDVYLKRYFYLAGVVRFGTRNALLLCENLLSKNPVQEDFSSEFILSASRNDSLGTALLELTNRYREFGSLKSEVRCQISDIRGLK